ncbi:MAG: SIMPL domain-containing protein, partial [Patescibacteria group bacterium]
MNERTKNYLGGAIILALLAFAYAIVSYANTFSRSIDPGSLRSFSVSGEGKVVAVPDVAQFAFSVITEGGTDIAKLQKENTDKVNRAIDFVKSKGVGAKDIRTESYNLSPRYQQYGCPRTGGPCPPAEIVGYTISQTVSVKIRDFAKIGETLAGVVENGANTVSQLDFTIDDPTEVQNSARAEAIEKAKAKASAIAKAGGFRVGKLLSINEGGGYPPVPYYDKFGRGGGLESAGIAIAPTIEPGSQDVVVN